MNPCLFMKIILIMLYKGISVNLHTYTHYISITSCNYTVTSIVKHSWKITMLTYMPFIKELQLCNYGLFCSISV